MHPSRRARTAALLLVTQASTACTSWRVQSVSPRDYLAQARPDAIRVTDTANARFVIRAPVVEGDSLRGLMNGLERRVPLAAIDRIAVRRLNGLKTVWWFVVAPIVVVTGLLALACAIDSCSINNHD